MKKKHAEMNAHSEDSFISNKMEWSPCVAEDENGRLYWGDTDTPILAIWEMHEALNYLRQTTLEKGHEAMKELLEVTGLKVELYGGEFIILEEKIK